MAVRSTRFHLDVRGVSAVEFAFGAPLLMILALVGYDTSRYVMATRQIEEVAATIGQMISVNQTGSVNYVDLQFFHDSAMLTFPAVLQDAAQLNKPWGNDIGISMASLQFTSSPNCGNNCTYVPKMVWTGGTTPRSCTVAPLPAPDTDAPTPKTLPVDVFGPNSLIVVDVSFTYRPTIAPKFMNALAINRSFYVAPRYVPTITYSKSSGDNGIASPC